MDDANVDYGSLDRDDSHLAVINKFSVDQISNPTNDLLFIAALKSRRIEWFSVWSIWRVVLFSITFLGIRQHHLTSIREISRRIIRPCRNYFLMTDENNRFVCVGVETTNQVSSMTGIVNRTSVGISEVRATISTDPNLFVKVFSAFDVEQRKFLTHRTPSVGQIHSACPMSTSMPWQTFLFIPTCGSSYNSFSKREKQNLRLIYSLREREKTSIQLLVDEFVLSDSEPTWERSDWERFRRWNAENVARPSIEWIGCGSVARDLSVGTRSSTTSESIGHVRHLIVRVQTMVRWKRSLRVRIAELRSKESTIEDAVCNDIDEAVEGSSTRTAVGEGFDGFRATRRNQHLRIETKNCPIQFAFDQLRHGAKVIENHRMSWTMGFQRTFAQLKTSEERKLTALIDQLWRISSLEKTFETVIERQWINRLRIQPRKSHRSIWCGVGSRCQRSDVARWRVRSLMEGSLDEPVNSKGWFRKKMIIGASKRELRGENTPSAQIPPRNTSLASRSRFIFFALQFNEKLITVTDEKRREKSRSRGQSQLFLLDFAQHALGEKKCAHWTWSASSRVQFLGINSFLSSSVWNIGRTRTTITRRLDSCCSPSSSFRDGSTLEKYFKTSTMITKVAIDTTFRIAMKEANGYRNELQDLDLRAQTFTQFTRIIVNQTITDGIDKSLSTTSTILASDVGTVINLRLTSLSLWVSSEEKRYRCSNRNSVRKVDHRSHRWKTLSFHWFDHLHWPT